MFEHIVVAPAAEVREQFRRVKPLKDISVAQRGWTVAAFGRKPPYNLRRSAETPLRHRLGKTAFTTADAYAFTPDKLR